MEQGWEYAQLVFNFEWITRFLRKMSEWAICSKKQAIHSLAHFWWAKWAIPSWSLIFGERPEWFAYCCSIKNSDWAKSDRSDSLLGVKRWGNCKKTYEKYDIVSNVLERIARLWAIRSWSAVALLSWATWANPSRSFFNLTNFEQKSEEWMSERVISQPCN